MKFVVAAVAAILFTSCAGMGPHVAGGFFYTGLKGPVGATMSKKSTKTGQSCASNVLGLVATGDNSIGAAKAAGGLDKVSSVDYDRFSILGFYTKVCTIVKGS